MEGLAQREASVVLVEELLSPELQEDLRKPIFSTVEARCHLLEKFGNLTLIIKGWVQELERTAAARKGGTRNQYQALVTTLLFLKRVMGLSPEVPEWEILIILGKPQMLNRVLETLQWQEEEGFRQEIGKKHLDPSRRRGAEILMALCTYLEQLIQGLRSAGPPAPFVYYHDEDDYKDEVSSYYSIQVDRAYALEDDEWRAPRLSYPCGLPGHLHSLAVCGEFWGMESGD